LGGGGEFGEPGMDGGGERALGAGAGGGDGGSGGDRGGSPDLLPLPRDVEVEVMRTVMAEDDVLGISEMQCYYLDSKLMVKVDIILHPDLLVRDAHTVARRIRSAVEEACPSVHEIDIDLELFESGPDMVPALYSEGGSEGEGNPRSGQSSRHKFAALKPPRPLGLGASPSGRADDTYTPLVK